MDMSLFKLSLKSAGIAAGVGCVGLLFFGSDLVSYAKTATGYVRDTVAEAIPIEVELKRARDMIDDLIPEMHANIKLVAQEEVEIEALETDIHRGGLALVSQREKIAKLRDTLKVEQANYQFGHTRYSRQDVVNDMSRRFEMMRNSGDILTGKQRLLDRRKQTLSASVQNLGEIRQAKIDLQGQVQMLESQFRTIQTAQSHSTVTIDGSQVAKVRQVIKQIKKRLDTAERVLEKEQFFVEMIPVDAVSEAELMEQVDAYLAPETAETDALASAPNWLD
jgi:predicted  nucleic acid-binding Zn-ribbon protein